MYNSKMDSWIWSWSIEAFLVFYHRGEQAYTMCTTQELMPLVGSSLPYPCILAAVIYQPDSPLQSIGKIYSDVPHTAVHDEDYNNPFDFCDEGLPASKTHLISISDDGKVWNWLLTTERADDYSTGTSYMKLETIVDDTF